MSFFGARTRVSPPPPPPHYGVWWKGHPILLTFVLGSTEISGALKLGGGLAGIGSTLSFPETAITVDGVCPGCAGCTTDPTLTSR